MKFEFLTLFPGSFASILSTSLLGKASDRGLVSFGVHDIRAHAKDKHRTADETPYGGGEGMLIKADILYAAWREVVPESLPPSMRARVRTILLSPQGPRFDAAKAKELATYDELVLVCGHYEGVDERFIELCVDEELSIGDYVLSGGEVPAMVLIEGVTRLLPGVLGNPDSAKFESFQEGLLEGPQYTRPALFRGRSVPEILLSGDHGAVARWRKEQARAATRSRRPDLWADAGARGATGVSGEDT